eukprot:COSAG02_NODE_1424_length_12684_cov_13.471116_10_plen_75_part_00
MNKGTTNIKQQAYLVPPTHCLAHTGRMIIILRADDLWLIVRGRARQTNSPGMAKGIRPDALCHCWHVLCVSSSG